MKHLSKVIIVLILLIGIFTIILQKKSLAAQVEGSESVGGAGTGIMLDTSITGSGFTSAMDPSRGGGASGTIEKPLIDTIIAVINPLLRVAQIIGGLLMIVSIAMYGINMLLATETFFGDIIKVRPNAQNLVELKKIG